MSLELVTNANQFARQTQRLLEIFEATQHPETGKCCKHSHAATRANCVVNLNDYWAQFCRNLLITSVKGGCKSRDGSNITMAPTIVSKRDDVISILRTKYRGRPMYFEPNWTVARDFIVACTHMDIANLSDVSAAIGSSPRTAEELRLTRNYLVHRNASTAARASAVLSSYGPVSPLNVDTLIARPARAGSSLFEIWLNGLIVIAFAAC